MGFNAPLPVIPAKAGIHRTYVPDVAGDWIPAFAGMTGSAGPGGAL
jgi:hypothetical protein